MFNQFRGTLKRFLGGKKGEKRLPHSYTDHETQTVQDEPSLPQQGEAWSPPFKRQDNTQPVGNNPITDFTVEYLGEQVADNSCSHRDLGFVGQIAGKWYTVFGDTMWCAPGVTDPMKDPPGFHGMVRDSISALTDNPLVVHDLNLNDDYPVPHQLQFVPFNPEWGETMFYSFGGMSLVETDAATATGAAYCLVNSAPFDYDGLVGAGVAKVQVINGTPTVTKRYGNRGVWWPADVNPRYGDAASYRDENSEYVYLWGGPPITDKDFVKQQYGYQARVRAADAFDLASYEYWWGRQAGWRREPLTAADCNETTAVTFCVGQGQVVYNRFFECYIFIHLDVWGAGNVYLKTAPAPEGPWAADVQIYKATPRDGGLVYAGAGYPYLDESGRTLVVSYTNNNVIEVIKVSFSK
ncbi:Conserved secreted protein [Pleurostoma richardsiae]|uniref:Conserved secreted protein n=1 Tax=Pleurostoma richardsiae TaxID=41990 RepID=A0AA38RBY1_9PEZI|nr:Conserved secreted protein [Pleurostoma richardsiae]